MTPHFPVEQLIRSKNGIPNNPPMAVAGNLAKLAQKLEEARAILGDLPLRVTYAYRGKELNDAVGSQDTSAHLLGLAADVVPSTIGLRAAWDTLADHPNFCSDVDQLIIERGCIHIGLAVPAHYNVPRHELRLDQDIDGVRRYPLYGHWTPQGVVRV